MEKLTIDRRMWLRGEGSECSVLFRPSDLKKCCLGIYLSSVGISNEEINSKRCPSDVDGELPDWLLDEKKDSYLCKELICVNDDNDGNLTEGDREEEIKDLFKTVDIEVKFIN